MAEWAPGDAKRFARQVKLGKTYYTIETVAGPLGDELMWRPWVFDKRQAFTGAAMCGAVSAEGVCLRNGPVYDSQPTHVLPLFEQGDEVYVTPADLIAMRKARKKAAHR